MVVVSGIVFGILTALLYAGVSTLFFSLVVSPPLFSTVEVKVLPVGRVYLPVDRI